MKKETRMKAGDTLVIAISVPDDIDLVGATVDWWLAKDSATAAEDAILKKSLGSGVTITGEAGALTVEVRIDAADSADLKGPYYHETKVTTSANVVARIHSGVLRVERTLIPTPTP